jgi:hypothetical protein
MLCYPNLNRLSDHFLASTAALKGLDKISGQFARRTLSVTDKGVAAREVV